MRIALIAIFSFLALPALADLNLYTDRPTARLQPLADQFEKKTGTKVNIVELAYPALLQKLEAEGKNGPADVIFVKDLVFLTDLAKKGWFQPMNSAAINTAVAPSMRDPKGLWTAVTVRARTIVYDPTRVNVADLSTYEDLAQPKWAGRLCLRSGRNNYNEALVAGLVATIGADKTKQVVQGWVDNLAQPTFPNDNAVIEAIASGTCEVGLVNSYYLAALQAQRPNLPVKIFFANQKTSGTHMNGTGAGVAVTSKQAALARAFVEMLLEDGSQLHLSSGHFDYPAKVGLTPNTHIKDWGQFTMNLLNWSLFGEKMDEARAIISGAGYQ
jgi:iron(III) transport system substrate-binding protein